MAKHWTALVGVALSLGLALAACGDGSGSGSASASGSGSGTGSGSGAGGEEEELAFPESEATTVLDVTLQDYAFVGIPASVQGPKVFFKTTIKGSSTHELEILDAEGDAVDEIEAYEGSETKEMALKLAPGTYTAQCLVEEGAKTHKQLGMTQTFTVT
jgi:hypothetical protein